MGGTIAAANYIISWMYTDVYQKDEMTALEAPTWDRQDLSNLRNFGCTALVNIKSPS